MVPERMLDCLILSAARQKTAGLAEDQAARLFGPVSSSKTQLNRWRTVCCTSDFDKWLEVLDHQANKSGSGWARCQNPISELVGELRSGTFWEDTRMTVQSQLVETGIRDCTVTLTERLKLELGRMHMNLVLEHALLSKRRV